MENLPALWIVIAAFMAAGLVKGTAGVGLPLTVLGVLTFFVDPRAAFSLAIVPIVTSNAIQLYRAGRVWTAFEKYLPFIICLVAGIPFFLWLSVDAPTETLFVFLGIVMIIFVALNLSPYVPRIADRHDRKAQIILGTLAGVMGGLTSIWLPAIAILLTARDSSKDEFIRASALLLMMGSLPLFFGYFSVGILDRATALLSASMLIPTMAGLFLGEKLRDRLSEKAFRNATLLLFFLIGLNLLRRGVFG